MSCRPRCLGGSSLPLLAFAAALLWGGLSSLVEARAEAAEARGVGELSLSHGGGWLAAGSGGFELRSGLLVGLNPACLGGTGGGGGVAPVVVAGSLPVSAIQLLDKWLASTTRLRLRALPSVTAPPGGLRLSSHGRSSSTDAQGAAVGPKGELTLNTSAIPVPAAASVPSFRPYSASATFSAAPCAWPWGLLMQP